MLPFIENSKILRITPVKDQTRAGDKDAAELQALPTSTETNVDICIFHIKQYAMVVVLISGPQVYQLCHNYYLSS